FASTLDGGNVFAWGVGDTRDERVMFGVRHASPSCRAEPFKRAIADFILHPLRSIDPVTQIDVTQASRLRAPDVIENDKIPKPRSRLMFRVVKTINHRQPVALPIS